MKTIIFDIDGTLTDMWPIEKSVLLSMLGNTKAAEVEEIHARGVKSTYQIFCKVLGTRITQAEYRRLYNRDFISLERKRLLPPPQPYPTVDWIRKNRNKYHFVYATGGQKLETAYVLKSFGIVRNFDAGYSISKSTYPFSKSTGLPFKKIKSRFPDCIVVTDSDGDVRGAKLANIPCIQI